MCFPPSLAVPVRFAVAVLQLSYTFIEIAESVLEPSEALLEIHEADEEPGLPLWLGVVALIKANVGPATLYLPYGIQQGGWLLTAVVLGLVFCMITVDGAVLMARGGRYACTGKILRARPWLYRHRSQREIAYL